jgi:hypothetical protein
MTAVGVGGRGRADEAQTHVDTSLSRVGACNLDQKPASYQHDFPVIRWCSHRLLERRLRQHLGGVADTSSSGDDLTTASVNGIGV